MNEKVVTYEDLDDLLRIKEAVGNAGCGVLVDRLIAVARADAPPLPEGWYLWRDEHGGTSTAVYVKGGRISRWDDGDGLFGQVTPGNRDRLTPLRPTVTEADIEKAAYAIFREHDRNGVEFSGIARGTSLAAAREAFRAAGIEVQP